MKQAVWTIAIVLCILSCNKKKQEVYIPSEVSLERPTLLSKGETVIPDSLTDISGWVYVKCLVDTLGQITTTIFRPSDIRLNKAALETIKTYKFTVGKLNGEKMATYVMVRIDFD